MDPDQAVLERIAQLAQSPTDQPRHVLNAVLQIAAARRIRYLAEYLIHKAGGAIVQSGPFAGMKYLPTSSGSLLPPKLLGCYEAELHAVVGRIIAAGYQNVVNIGCGEGYYAVGLARVMPRSRVIAFDSTPLAQRLCTQLAELNGLSGHVNVRATCGHAELSESVQSKSVVLCDCEGGETALLDPEKVVALQRCDILVELHEFLDPLITERMTRRFSETHDIELISHGPRDPNEFPLLRGLSQLDQMLSMHEGRPGPTPWAFLRARAET